MQKRIGYAVSPIHLVYTHSHVRLTPPEFLLFVLQG